MTTSQIRTTITVVSLLLAVAVAVSVARHVVDSFGTVTVLMQEQ